MSRQVRRHGPNALSVFEDYGECGCSARFFRRGQDGSWSPPLPDGIDGITPAADVDRFEGESTAIIVRDTEAVRVSGSDVWELGSLRRDWRERPLWQIRDPKEPEWSPVREVRP